MGSDYYVPQSVLLTGAAGFVGSHAANRFVQGNCKLVALDRLNQCSSLDNLRHCWGSPDFKFLRGDVANSDLVNHILQAEEIDTVLHFAAQTHVGSFDHTNLSFTNNNIAATHALMQACTEYGKVRRFVYISTDEVYGETSDSNGNSEDAALCPSNPYAASKAGAEMMVMAYGKSHHLPYIILRCNNMYGPKQYPKKLIPKFILLALQSKPMQVHGRGSALQELLYVDDAVSAFEVALRKGVVGELYNVGGAEERSVLEVAKDICEHFKLDNEQMIRFNSDNFNGKRFVLDSTKMHRLGWRTTTSWEQGLKETIAWYAQNSGWWQDVSNDHGHIPRISCKGSVKILIYGKTGWIGGLLGRICKQQGIAFEFGKGRLENRHEIEADIKSVEPTHVINAAGITGYFNADWCEDHKVETLRGNVFGALVVADVCKSKGLINVQFGSGCIYEYDEQHPCGSGIGFTEEDVPNCTCSFFSKSKAMAQNLLKSYDNVCWLRIRLPLSSNLGHPKNLIYKLLKYKKVVNIPNSMSVLDELLPVAVSMTINNCTGIWNFTNPGTISHNELLQLYKEYVDYTTSWTNFSQEDQSKVLKSYRCHNELNSSKLLKLFPQVLPIKKSLIKYVFEPNKTQGLLRSSL